MSLATKNFTTKRYAHTTGKLPLSSLFGTGNWLTGSSKEFQRRLFSLSNTFRSSSCTSPSLLASSFHSNCRELTGNSDGNIAPTEVASCLQSPWKVLSPYISPDLYQLLTSPKSRLSDASNLQTLEICAEGVLLASKMIDQTVSFFLQNCPKLQRVVATFPLHELEMQQLYTLRQMLDHFSHQSNSDDNNNNNRNFTMIVPDAK